MIGPGDEDDWALVRVAELRARGESAGFRLVWRRDDKGRRLYSVQVRREGGRVESRQDVLGPLREASPDGEGLREELRTLYRHGPDGDLWGKEPSR